jgi:hypothetical protein
MYCEPHLPPHSEKQRESYKCISNSKLFRNVTCINVGRCYHGNVLTLCIIEHVWWSNLRFIDSKLINITVLTTEFI